MGDHKAHFRGEHGTQDTCVCRGVALHTAQGLDDASALHLVVVLADDVFLGADVEAAEHGLEEIALLDACIVKGNVLVLRTLPGGLQGELRHAVVHEVHANGAHHAVAISHLEEAGIREVAENRGLHVHFLCHLAEEGHMLLRHCKRHALLGLGDKDFPGTQAVVLQGSKGDVQHAAASVLGHFAHRGGKAARAVVGDGVVEAHVAGAQDEVVHLALGDGVTNLHCSGRRVFVQLLRGEGGTVYAVLAYAAAHHDDTVVNFGLLLPAWLAVLEPCRQHAHSAAVDQGLS